MKRLLLILCLLCSMVQAAQAQYIVADSECIQKAKGRQVLWDSSWQDDKSDHGVRYIIKGISLRKAPPAIELQLVAVDAATISRRTATITRGYVAQLFCDRLLKLSSASTVQASEGSFRSFGAGEEIPQTFPQREAQAGDLLFRTWDGTRWLPANPEPGTRSFVCALPHRSYACSKSDFETVHKARAKKNAKAPAAYTKTLLPREFLRYTKEYGWVRQLPLDLSDEQLFTTCSLGGYDFKCLQEEKRNFSEELRSLRALERFWLKWKKLQEEAAAPAPEKEKPEEK